MIFVWIVLRAKKYQHPSTSMEQELSSPTKVTIEGNISEGIGDMPDEEGVAEATEAEKVFDQSFDARGG